MTGLKYFGEKEVCCSNCRFSHRNNKNKETASCHKRRDLFYGISKGTLQCDNNSFFSPVLEAGMKVVAIKDSDNGCIKAGQNFIVYNSLEGGTWVQVRKEGDFMNLSCFYDGSLFVMPPSLKEAKDKKKAEKYLCANFGSFLYTYGSFSRSPTGHPSTRSFEPEEICIEKPFEKPSPKKYEIWGDISLNVVVNDAIEDNRRSFIVKAENNSFVGIRRDFYASIEGVSENFIETCGVGYDSVRKAFVSAELSSSAFTFYIIQNSEISKWIAFLRKEKRTFEAYSKNKKAKAVELSKTALKEYKAAKEDIKKKRKEIFESKLLTKEEKNIVLGRLQDPEKPDHFIVFGPVE